MRRPLPLLVSVVLLAVSLVVTPATASTVVRFPGEPNPSLTPGELNPAVTQATIRTTICNTGWTATIRPSSAYTTALKIKQIRQYGYRVTATSAYEEDHLISLELGGAPRDPRNLWPEPYSITTAHGTPVGARTKDTYENRLHKAVCAGTMSLAQARARIGLHLVHYWLGLPLSAPHP